MQGIESGRFIEPPRAVEQQLREAEKALAEQRYSDAVVRLGELLAVERAGEGEDFDLAGQDFFLDRPDESADTAAPLQASLLRQARRMIAGLPAEAIETYELRYGPLARKLLGEAADWRDVEKVREVRRKYFHTLAGYEASALLAQQEILAGHPLAASILLDDVVTAPRAVAHLGQGIVLLHASALRLAGRPLPSVDAAGQAIVVGGTSQTWPEADDLVAWLDERFASLDDFDPSPAGDYPLFGTSPDRNGSSSGQMPLTNLRWKLDTTASPRQARTVRNLADELATSGKLPPPSWVPLRVGDQLLMRTTERLVGVDYRTGKRIWTYPWQSTYEFFDEEESSLDGLSGITDPNQLLSQRVWNDVPYGQISSDGQRVYILDQLGEVEMAALSPMINLGGTRPADTGTNTLVALDLASEGKLCWRLGSDSDVESTLSTAFFLGPPLPLDGRLYVLAEIAGDINLCCLDPLSGKEWWRQQLVAVESGGIDVDPIRRVAGAMPTYHEGVLICPTGAGAIVALDLGDRMFRWGVSYQRNREMSLSIRGQGLEADLLMQRWFTGTAVASGGSVVVTPIESDRLLGLDLLTGTSLFAEQSRKYMRYLAGVRDGRFLVVGANQVQAFELATGQAVWTTPRDLLAAGQHISGSGVFGKDAYFLPTTSNQIVQISLADGSVIDRRTTNFPLGNLVAVEGELISQGPTSLAVAFGEATLEPLVDRMLQQNPDDFEALVRKSELLIQRGNRDEALDLLARAREMQPDSDEVRMLSVSAMLGTLREDLAAGSELVETLDSLIDQPAQRVELLSLRIRAAMLAKDYEEAGRRMLDLSSLIISEPMLESSADQVVNDSSRQCSLDGWLAARVQEMTRVMEPEQRVAISELVRQQMETQRQGSTSLLKRIVRHFGNLPGTEPIRNELADRLRADEANLELERLALGSLIPSSGGLQSLSPARLEMLADAYASGGMPKDALAVLEELQSRGDATVAERMTELRELASSQLTSHPWPDTSSLKWDSNDLRIRTMSLTQRVADTKVLAGREFEGWRVVSEGASPLAFRDPTGMLRRIPIEAGRPDEMDKEAQVSGGVMVVVTSNGLVGLDLHHLLAGDGEAVIWRRGLGGDSGPVAKRRSTMTPFDDQVVRYYISPTTTSNVIPEFKLGPIMGDRVLLLQGGDLLAIDLFTAETLWRNSTAPKSGAVLCDGERVAVVSSATGEVVFYDLLDGQKLDSAGWDHGTVWESAASHVLAYRQTDENGHYELTLVNPFTGQVLLRQLSPQANRSNTDREIPAAYGRVVSGRYLVLLDNQGQAVIWDLAEGRELSRPKLPVYGDLQGLRVILLDGQLIVLPRRAGQQDRDLQTTNGTFHQTVHAVHAISLQDGEVRWSQEFETPWGCTLTQPAETPLLMFTRSPSTFSASNPTRRKFMDVLALDVRDGHELNKTLGRPIQSSNNDLETRLVVQPGLSRVLVHIGSDLLTYSFGQPAAEPPP
jgi:outer membrane protein assembly factor BamB